MKTYKKFLALLSMTFLLSSCNLSSAGRNSSNDTKESTSENGGNTSSGNSQHDSDNTTGHEDVTSDDVTSGDTTSGDDPSTDTTGGDQGGGDEFDTGYYSSINKSWTENELLNGLNSLNNSKRKSTVGYGGIRYFAAKCDIDPQGNGHIIGFYDNADVGTTWNSSVWNREHVWPDSRGGGLVEGDAHMTRPCSKSENSGRGSKGFGYDSYDPGYKVPFYRGVASRIIFYCAIANKNLKIEDIILNYDWGNAKDPGKANTMGTLSDMLEWNLAYLPTATLSNNADKVAQRVELNRNEVIQNDTDGQGNRNPFIDHPEYACRIWGNTNAKTKQICGLK